METMQQLPKRRHLLYALLVIFCLVPALSGQTPPTITTTSTLVIVPALVQVPSGDLLQTLHTSDFLLTDNGTAQTVTLEDTEHQPVSIVVLLQTGGAAVEELPLYAKLDTMLGYLTANSPHQVAMVTFDSQPEYQWDFTPDVSDLDDGFTKPGPGDRGAAILDAVSHGIDMLSQQPPTQRRILIVISQSHDDRSHARSEDIIRRLGENNITIECLTFSPEETWLKDQFTKPRHANPPYQLSPDLPMVSGTFNLDQPLREALSAMRENTGGAIAALSGGEAFTFDSKASLEQQLALLANHFAATLTLSFRPTSKQPGFHSLHVQIAGHPEMQVSARTSYWATGDLPASK
jgi:VWFA-related protein